MELFFTTLQQVAVLLIFIFVGYFLRKKEIITEGGKKVLSKLLVYLFAPCYSVMSLSTIVNPRFGYDADRVYADGKARGRLLRREN